MFNNVKDLDMAEPKLARELQLHEIDDVVHKVRRMILENQEWELRYGDYSQRLLENLEFIKKNRNLIRQWEPFKSI